MHVCMYVCTWLWLSLAYFWLDADGVTDLLEEAFGTVDDDLAGDGLIKVRFGVWYFGALGIRLLRGLDDSGCGILDGICLGLLDEMLEAGDTGNLVGKVACK